MTTKAIKDYGHLLSDDESHANKSHTDKAKKISQLTKDLSELIAAEKLDIIDTANIGCQLHPGTQAKQSVQHCIELLDQAG